ncbi:uncharacterized protein RSE6_14304 [Rhynchosporium secalis]|uniref:Uncharacterized protein n=1 Tax=Rhynchosporium secalis TaxID=38038 RepID=A0A1E1MV09_RHYSE|nr:uncharacterized protein RSE6_14304 [Rhynchosporium secalis]
MPTHIELLLTAKNLHDSFSLSSATSPYKTFQTLFLVECPADDPNILQKIQFNAAFLEYLSTQRVSRIRELLRTWHVQSMEAENDKDKLEAELEHEKHANKEKDAVGVTVICSDEEILEEIVKQIRDGVDVVCVYFEGQEVDAIDKLEEVKKKVVDILNQNTTWKWPKFVCQPMEAF